MCYEFEEFYRQQRAEEARRKALEDERRRQAPAPARPADKPKEQPQPVPVCAGSSAPNPAREAGFVLEIGA